MKKSLLQHRQESNFTIYLLTGPQHYSNRWMLLEVSPVPSTYCLLTIFPMFSVHFCMAVLIFNTLTWRPCGQCDPVVSTVTFSKCRFYLPTSFAYASFSQVIICAVSQHCQSPRTVLFLELRSNTAVPVSQWHSSHCFLWTHRNFSEHHFVFLLSFIHLWRKFYCAHHLNIWSLDQYLKAKATPVKSLGHFHS